jgi:hypothetical protein
MPCKCSVSWIRQRAKKPVPVTSIGLPALSTPRAVATDGRASS